LDKAERLFNPSSNPSLAEGEHESVPKISKEDDNFTTKLLHKTIKKV